VGQSGMQPLFATFTMLICSTRHKTIKIIKVYFVCLHACSRCVSEETHHQSEECEVMESVATVQSSHLNRCTHTPLVRQTSLIFEIRKGSLNDIIALTRHKKKKAKPVHCSPLSRSLWRFGSCEKHCVTSGGEYSKSVRKRRRKKTPQYGQQLNARHAARRRRKKGLKFQISHWRPRFRNLGQFNKLFTTESSNPIAPSGHP
jgi:hypothetical protein